WLNAPWPQTGTQLQALLLEQGQDRWQLVVAVPRLAADAGSLAVLFDGLAQAYEAEMHGEIEETGQFAQYLEWRSEVLFDEDAESARQYWQAQLPDEQGALAPSLPYRQDPAVGQVHRCDAI